MVFALDKMSELDEEDNFYVSSEIKNTAVKILSYVKQTDYPMPKILPEGGDCLSLTWDSPSLKRFLTIHEDELESTVYSKVGNFRCVQFSRLENGFHTLINAVPKAVTVE